LAQRTSWILAERTEVTPSAGQGIPLAVVLSFFAPSDGAPDLSAV
jgi:hypothetical protein